MTDSRSGPAPTVAWLLVFLAAVFEVCWAVGLPWTEGLTRPGPTVVVILLMVSSFLPLARATRTLPIGPAYAVWTGLGAGGTAVVAILVHGEPVTAGRVIGILLVVAGVGGLRFLPSRDEGVPPPTMRCGDAG